MRYRDRPSWRISRGIDEALTTVLYIRDVAGLARYVLTDPDLPPVHPAVPADPGDVDLRAAIREWERWWARALALSPHRPAPVPWPPGWAGLEDLPTMRTLAERHSDDFRDWRGRIDASATWKRPGPLPDLTGFVNGYAERLGRPVRPFDLLIRELPLQGPGGWVLDHRQVLISSELLNDGDAFRAFLKPVIDVLA